MIKDEFSFPCFTSCTSISVCIVAFRKVNEYEVLFCRADVSDVPGRGRNFCLCRVVVAGGASHELTACCGRPVENIFDCSVGATKM